MALTFYYASGSPYAWRVWLALERKGAPYTLKTLSFDAGDLAKPEFHALNPRQRIPVITDDGFTLYESAAIVEYIEDRWPEGPRLFAEDVRTRAVQRRMIREADQYVAPLMERLAETVLFTPPERQAAAQIAAAGADFKKELTGWEAVAGDALTDALSAADFTLYPQLALVQRIAARKPEVAAMDLIGPRISAWMRHMGQLPLTRKTWPPHWTSGSPAS
jgi:glutathione S-transferase